MVSYLDPPCLARVHQDLLQNPMVPELELEVIAKGGSPKQCLVISAPLRVSPAMRDNQKPRLQPYLHKHANYQSQAAMQTHSGTQNCAKQQQQQRPTISIPLEALDKSWAQSWHLLVVCGQFLLLFV